MTEAVPYLQWVRETLLDRKAEDVYGCGLYLHALGESSLEDGV